MPDIVVLRGAGLVQGEDIIDPLLSTIHACQSRGVVALDSGSGLAPVKIDCVFREGLLLGQLVEVFNPFSGGLRYGKITSIDLTATAMGIDTSLSVSVVSEDLL